MSNARTIGRSRPEPLFVGATRPAMRWGVPFSVLLVNGVLTMEAFLLTRNLPVLLLCMPMHGLAALLCSRDPRFFELALLWVRTGLVASLRNRQVWKASSYSPLAIELPGARGRRRPPAMACLTARLPVGRVL